MQHRPWTTRTSLAALLATTLLVPLISGCETTIPLHSTTSVNGCINVSCIPPVDSKVCINGKCLTYSVWGHNIDTAINQQGVGYAYIIEHEGAGGTNNAFGQARTAADPLPGQQGPTAMTLLSHEDIASVTKTLTAVAALKLLKAKGISLSTHISAYLPTTWRLGQYVDTITFAELLTQTSGIIEPSILPDTTISDTTYADLQTTMSQPIYLTTPANVTPPPKWTKQSCKQDWQNRLTGGNHFPCYQNANFALFRILIPYLNGYTDGGVSTTAQIMAATDQGYLDYMNSVYGPYMNSVYGPNLTISCTPAQVTPYALTYLYPAGTTPGIDWGDYYDSCGGAGLQLSVSDMANFLSRLMRGAYLPIASTSVTSSTDYSVTAMVKYLYGWDVKYPTTTYGTCVQKNGGLIGSRGNLHTLIVYCPATGLGFAGLANSDLGPSHTAWDGIVENAYNASWQ